MSHVLPRLLGLLGTSDDYIILGTLPFASGILAYMFLGETMDCYTINTMAVCYGAIALLACADDSDADLKEVSDRSA